LYTFAELYYNKLCLGKDEKELQLMGLPIYLIRDSGWATDKEFDKMKLARPVNEGWLYSKDDKSIKLFASYDKDDNEITFGDRTMIPRAWVKKIQKL